MNYCEIWGHNWKLAGEKYVTDHYIKQIKEVTWLQNWYCTNCPLTAERDFTNETDLRQNTI
jgi:hypothetical protein